MLNHFCSSVDVFSLNGGDLEYWLARCASNSAEEDKSIRIANYCGNYVFDDAALEAAHLMISRKYGKYLPERSFWP